MVKIVTQNGKNDDSELQLQLIKKLHNYDMPFILMRASLLAQRVGLGSGKLTNVLTCLPADLTGEACTCLLGEAVFTGDDGFSAVCCS